jgi:hypothetical protein
LDRENPEAVKKENFGKFSSQGQTKLLILHAHNLGLGRT